MSELSKFHEAWQVLYSLESLKLNASDSFPLCCPWIASSISLIVVQSSRWYCQRYWINTVLFRVCISVFSVQSNAWVSAPDPLFWKGGWTNAAAQTCLSVKNCWSRAPKSLSFANSELIMAMLCQGKSHKLIPVSKYSAVTWCGLDFIPMVTRKRPRKADFSFHLTS